MERVQSPLHRVQHHARRHSRTFARRRCFRNEAPPGPCCQLWSAYRRLNRNQPVSRSNPRIPASSHRTIDSIVAIRAHNDRLRIGNSNLIRSLQHQRRGHSMALRTLLATASPGETASNTDATRASAITTRSCPNGDNASRFMWSSTFGLA